MKFNQPARNDKQRHFGFSKLDPRPSDSRRTFGFPARTQTSPEQFYPNFTVHVTEGNTRVAR